MNLTLLRGSYDSVDNVFGVIGAADELENQARAAGLSYSQNYLAQTYPTTFRDIRAIEK